MAAQENIPEFLYHVKRTITDYHADKSGATRTTDILNTFTDLKAAKAAAHSALASEGYLKDDFEIYEDNAGEEEWKHGDGVVVFAKAPAGQEFEVRLDTKPNTPKLKGNASGEVEGVLHYVLQTTINYNNDRIGGIQTTEIEGTYPIRKDAYAAAHTALLDDEVTKETFAEYDEKENFVGEWPYGDDCFVHAVAETGENFTVSVKAQPHAHKHHSCKHHGGSKCEFDIRYSIFDTHGASRPKSLRSLGCIVWWGGILGRLKAEVHVHTAEFALLEGSIEAVEWLLAALRKEAAGEECFAEASSSYSTTSSSSNYYNTEEEIDLNAESWKLPYSIDDSDLTFDGKPLNMLYEENKWQAEHSRDGEKVCKAAGYQGENALALASSQCNARRGERTSENAVSEDHMLRLTKENCQGCGTSDYACDGNFAMQEREGQKRAGGSG
ncbi:hypothetical protein G7Y89_g3205 [Cudoniella acicularis]|uniref:Uncharacterized protein n=1 Tax=Cudoniella acicularis TaxID=354080 RepID=A0A8H4RT08_9HELO|nr:hypothetical protein G7Y89_g3205 [Cudoniella acicularis]